MRRFYNYLARSGEMMYIFVLALFASAASETILVVTPQTHLSEGRGTTTEDDSYVEAYREEHDVARDRRNPLGSYEDNYSTLSHSSFIEDDVYPELNHVTTQHHKPHRHQNRHHRHPTAAVMYGPPTPLSHHHHHHHQPHPEQFSSHHTLIDTFPPFHFVSIFLHKFGLHKIVKIIAKIAVLKVILKFITAVALFVVLPAFVPQEKEKDDSDDDDGDGLLKNLGEVTNRVWNGIAAREKMDALDRRKNHENQYRIQRNNSDVHENPPQQAAQHPDADKCKDKYMDKDKDMCKDKDKDKDKNKDKGKDKCKDKDKSLRKDKCKEIDKEMDAHEDEGELDDIDVKLLKKIIKQWKEENFGGPDKSSAISFLRHCVATVNRILGILLGYLKMKHGNMDALDDFMFGRFSAYMKQFVKIWPHIMSGWKG